MDTVAFIPSPARLGLRAGGAAHSRRTPSVPSACVRAPSVPTGRRDSTPRLLAGRRSSRSPLATAALGALRPRRPLRPRCPGSERAAAPLALRRSPQPSTPRLPAGRHCSRSPPAAAALGLRWPSRPSTPGLPASHRGSHSPQAALLLVRRRAARDAGRPARGARWRVTGWKGARVFFLSV